MTTMDTATKARLDTEHAQLTERLEKLKEFIRTDRFTELPPIDREDLRQQYKHMEAYHEVLSRRVARHGAEP